MPLPYNIVVVEVEPFFDLAQAVAKVESTLDGTEETTAQPILVLLSGLPGTGKSFLARRLTAALPFVVIESDRVRKVLFPQPRYTAEESRWVHRTCHALMDRLLRGGVRVIYDATNLVEYHRELVYRSAREAGAKLVVVRTVAPEQVVRERLQNRPGREEVASDADWKIYRRMASRQEPIRHAHLVVDTTQGAEEAVEKILRLARR
jgi:predicted kinase